MFLHMMYNLKPLTFQQVTTNKANKPKISKPIHKVSHINISKQFTMSNSNSKSTHFPQSIKLKSLVVCAIQDAVHYVRLKYEDLLVQIKQIQPK